MSIGEHIKKYLFAGAIAVVPAIITFAAIEKIVEISDKIMVFIPEAYHAKSLIGFHVPGQGLVILTLILIMLGVLVKNTVGKFFHDFFVKAIMKVPGVSSIFNIVKQLMESFINSGESFKQAYLIQYPQKGQWTICFETGERRSELHEKLMEHTKGAAEGCIKDPVNIYVPTTPNPTSGFYLIADRDSLIKLKMPVEDALKVLVTGGVVIPDLNNDDKTNDKDKK